SVFRPMVDRSALLVFVPYLLIVMAAGTRDLARKKLFAAPLAVVLILLFAASTWFFSTMPFSVRDYAGFATAINERLEPGDLIFVKPRAWDVTPLFYYVD